MRSFLIGESGTFLSGVRFPHTHRCQRDGCCYGSRHDPHFTGVSRMHPPYLANGERAHRSCRVIDLLAAVQANHISLPLKRKWACQMVVVAAKDDFVQEVVDCNKYLHEQDPLLPRNLDFDLEGQKSGAQKREDRRSL